MSDISAKQPMPLAITMGEPSGVGAELTIKAWKYFTSPVLHTKHSNLNFFCIDDPDRLRRICDQLNYAVDIVEIDHPHKATDVFKTALPVLPINLPAHSSLGTLNSKNGNTVVSSIEKAVSLTMEGLSSAVITNPIHKATLYDAGFKYPGHTEYLAALAGLKTDSVMMLSSSELRVVPVTIHQSLSSAIKSLDSEKIIYTATVVCNALKNDYGLKSPRLAISGLNPHAGESGTMGHEDEKIILPAIKTLQKAGIDAFGPLPADTMFHKEARDNYDVAICMYHDQALIPIKTLDFHGGVNVTLGLPFIRTSPDHGTALDIAGKDAVNPTSFINAIMMAYDMAIAKINK